MSMRIMTTLRQGVFTLPVTLGVLWVDSPPGMGELVIRDGRFTTKKYLEVLEEVILPTVCLPYPEHIIFM